MNGMNAITGQLITNDYQHLVQSVNDILTTPLGSRVMLREYGSNIPNLIDAPMNPETFAAIYAATAEALDKWEPRLRLTQVIIREITYEGKCTMELIGYYLGTLVDFPVEILKV